MAIFLREISQNQQLPLRYQIKSPVDLIWVLIVMNLTHFYQENVHKSKAGYFKFFLIILIF